ncbi:MAG: HDIG domain-containing protein [Candidatus Parcubacteria bacterium]|nr:MAG: HDIG domain-containing protein [Candidatus Parcubacteria bacterium]
MKINPNKVPKEVRDVWFKLIKNNYESYLVGGCVRDLLLNKKPKDWDITTKAKPEEIKKIFPNSFYENKFFTVGVKTESNDPTLKIIEITTFRIEGKYSDFRHPDKVKYAQTLKNDLKRRDFTINALALDKDFKIIDYFNGLNDIKDRIIKTVGKPEERFKEDPLRMIRAIRLACQLNFEIENKTFETIKKISSFIQLISKERIKDEFIKIIMNENALRGLELLRESNLLIEIIPELIRCYQVSQNKHHKYDVYTHLLKSLEYAVKKNYSLEIRLAALFHDIGKPLTKKGEGPDCTFYNHEIVGAKITKNILQRLKFPKKIVERVVHLVKHHMFYLEIDKISMSAVRRLVNRLGLENIEDFFKLREADRIGSGVQKAVPYRLRYLKYLIHKSQIEPITPKILKINGHDIMKTLNITPGPRVGWIIKILLNEIIDDPNKNEKEYLLSRIKELNKLDDIKLKNMSEEGETKLREIEKKVDEDLKQKFKII